MGNYNLNQGQRECADAFFTFLFSENKEFIISGPAGYGKTYLMSYLIDEAMPRYMEACKLVDIQPVYTGVVMTATTNKAAEVLAQATKRPAKTVHSFFNLRVQEDYDSGETKIQKTHKWVVHQNLIIFVDECSMIDKALWEVINEGTSKCKVVYVGDHNQLAPVHEKISPIYAQRSPFFELTEPMRNSGQPALIEACQQLRETVATGIFRPITIVPGVIDNLSGPETQAEIDRRFQTQNLNDKILAYTNKRVIEYNDYIRSLRNLPSTLQVGENVVNAATYTAANQQIMSVDSECVIMSVNGPSQFVIEYNDKLEPYAYLDVDFVELETRIGTRFFNVPIPRDKEHYRALLKYYANKKDWVRFFRLKNEVIDLRPRDASTVHKSQGSTYDTVFIDLQNISACNFKDQVARMLYVAFSRAKSRIFLYGKLSDKYGGLKHPK